MMTRQRLLVACGVSTLALSAAVFAREVDRRPLIVTDVSGAVRVVQDLPCGDPVDVTRRLVGGRIEIIPTEVKERGVTIVELTQLTASFEAFSVERSCMGMSARAEFSEIGVRLAGAVSLQTVKRADRYVFTVPIEQFLFYESVVENGTRQPRYRRPSQDVTGEIDLARGTVRLRVVLAYQQHFRAGCTRSTPGESCLDVFLDGTQTADILGRNAFPDADGDRVPDQRDNCPLVSNADQTPIATPVLIPAADLTLSSCLDRNIGTARAHDVCAARTVKITSDAPRRFAIGANRVTWSADDKVDPIVTAVQTVTVEDTRPPAIACTATPPTGRFRVSADDDCGAATIRLGEFTLADGDVIHIQESDVPGVRLIGTSRLDRIRLFEAGRGQAIISAIDAAGNVSHTVCR